MCDIFHTVTTGSLCTSFVPGLLDPDEDEPLLRPDPSEWLLPLDSGRSREDRYLIACLAFSTSALDRDWLEGSVGRSERCAISLLWWTRGNYACAYLWFQNVLWNDFRNVSRNDFRNVHWIAEPRSKNHQHVRRIAEPRSKNCKQPALWESTTFVTLGVP